MLCPGAKRVLDRVITTFIYLNVKNRNMKTIKYLILGLLVILLLVTAGCGLKEVAGALSECVTKCSDLCKMINENNFDLGGYNTLQIAKQSGGTTVSCSCSCKKSQ